MWRGPAARRRCEMKTASALKDNFLASALLASTHIHTRQRCIKRQVNSAEVEKCLFLFLQHTRHEKATPGPKCRPPIKSPLVARSVCSWTSVARSLLQSRDS